MLRVGGLLVCLMVLALPAQAQRGKHNDLVLLGEKSVGFLVDRDVIEVGNRKTGSRSRVPEPALQGGAQ